MPLLAAVENQVCIAMDTMKLYLWQVSGRMEKLSVAINEILQSQNKRPGR